MIWPLKVRVTGRVLVFLIIMVGAEIKRGLKSPAVTPKRADFELNCTSNLFLCPFFGLSVFFFILLPEYLDHQLSGVNSG